MAQKTTTSTVVHSGDYGIATPLPHAVEADGLNSPTMFWLKHDPSGRKIGERQWAS